MAGAGVALFAGSAENVAWYLGRMGKRTIGGDKVNQLRHVRALRDSEGLLALMDRHRAIVAPKFAAVSDAFQQHLGGTGVAEWTAPKGGYFISLDVLDGCARELVRLSKEAGVELTPAGSTHPLGKDPRVREALELSLDRDAIVKVVMEGEAQPGNQWVAPSNQYYGKSARIPKRDVARAKQLLKEAGVPNPSFTLMVATTSDAQKIAQVVQAMAKDAGFDRRRAELVEGLSPH